MAECKTLHSPVKKAVNNSFFRYFIYLSVDSVTDGDYWIANASTPQIDITVNYENPSLHPADYCVLVAYHADFDAKNFSGLFVKLPPMGQSYTKKIVRTFANDTKIALKVTADTVSSTQFRLSIVFLPDESSVTYCRVYETPLLVAQYLS